MAIVPSSPKSKVSESNVVVPGGFEIKFHWRILGSHAPVFPGFEIDICDKVAEEDKPDAIWHRERARGMLKAHPEIKQLFGRSRWTAVWCLTVAICHVGIGFLVGEMPWWVALAAAYVVGTMLNIAMFNLAHECNHGLVFKQKKWNRRLFTVTSLPMLLPAHHTWWIEHHVHHNEMGAKQDFVKRRRSILLYMKDRILGKPVEGFIRDWFGWITTPLFWPVAFFVMCLQLVRTVIGLLIYVVADLATGNIKPSDGTLSILADEHLVSGYKKYGIETWAVSYPLLSLLFYAVFIAVAGWTAFFYLVASAVFMTGFLHPLSFGLMLSNSHFYGFKDHQPTSSYYGYLNWLTFNFGLHTEHHDLASIPWYRLGELRRIAPEYYDPLKKTTSFAAIAFKFAFGSREQFNNEEYLNANTIRNEV